MLWRSHPASVCNVTFFFCTRCFPRGAHHPFSRAVMFHMHPQDLSVESREDNKKRGRISSSVLQQHQRSVAYILVKTSPTIRSQLIHKRSLFYKVCDGLSSEPVLGNCNADWLALNTISENVTSGARQKLMIDLVRDGVFLDTLSLTDKKSSVGTFVEGFIGYHFVTSGPSSCLNELFRRCVCVARELDEKMITTDFKNKYNTTARFLGNPVRIMCDSALQQQKRRQHKFALNPPQKDSRGIFVEDFSSVLTLPNLGVVSVYMTRGALNHHKISVMWDLDVQCSCDQMDGKGTEVTFSLTLVEMSFYENHSVPRFLLNPKCMRSNSGTMLVPTPLNMCRMLRILRRGRDAMAIIGVFVFDHLMLQDPHGLKRFLSGDTHEAWSRLCEVVDDIGDASSSDKLHVRNRSWKVLKALAQASAASSAVHNSDTTFISALSV